MGWKIVSSLPEHMRTRATPRSAPHRPHHRLKLGLDQHRAPANQHCHHIHLEAGGRGHALDLRVPPELEALPRAAHRPRAQFHLEALLRAGGGVVSPSSRHCLEVVTSGGLESRPRA
ncbi:UNVERIFIED_CONTAM: hypothetical protein Sradi_5841900 [Sesamum radiatum]|uniref:Uncharacterized protein n=1 Tax=Sesamum radiatum TaxID=300843 RepID=A0AAW2KTF0_SESRA